MSTVHDLKGPTSPVEVDPPRFPTSPYANAASYFSAYMEEATRAVSSVEETAFSRVAAILLEAYTNGATVFACGNGGSAAIANHLQCDHMKGIREGTDLVPRVTSLSVNVELLTAIANDLTYGDVFAYQLQSQSRPGDVLIAVSSSGNSVNIVRALEWARSHDLRTIALTGFDGGRARAVAEVAVHVHSANYGVIEDLHQAIMHALAQYIRHSRVISGAISSNVF